MAGHTSLVLPLPLMNSKRLFFACLRESEPISSSSVRGPRDSGIHDIVKGYVLVLSSFTRYYIHFSTATAVLSGAFKLRCYISKTNQAGSSTLSLDDSM